MTPKSPLELLQAAAEHHGAGDLPAAELLYRAALHREPHPVGQHLLGALLHATGRFDEAVTYLSQAAENLPDDGELLGNYGAALVSANRHADALPVLNRAVEAGANSAAVLVNRSAAHRGVKNFAAALDDAQRALAIQPDMPGAFANAAVALQSLGRWDEALALLLRGLEMHPGEPTLSTNTGAILLMQGHPDAARDHLMRAIAINPDFADAQQMLGAALQELGDLPHADSCFHRALEINPDHVGALTNLGSLDLLRGRVDLALARFEAAMAVDPENPEAGSNSLLTLNYLPGLPSTAVADLHKAWGVRLLRPERSFEPRTSDRRARVGFLSPDLWRHPVATFIEPLLRSVDAEQFDLRVYNDRARGDAVTDRLRALPVGWTDVAGMPGAALVERIRDDEIDILIELSGHTAGNRLIDLADRAAPIQMTMIGYPNRTGLPTIDYRIGDAIADPEAADENWRTERLLRLDGGFLCWRPPENAPTPHASAGRPVTFGSFNALAKLSTHTISAWAAILNSVPDSRLLLKSKAFGDPETHSRILRAFSAHSISASRLELVSWLPETQDHLGFYREIDVALDPFPYNGTTTTMEALWMGVPVISLIGESHPGRVGASILTHAGLVEDLTTDVGAYINRAVALARSAEIRMKRRETLREQLQASPLLDGDRYARAMEDAWRQTLALLR